MSKKNKVSKFVVVMQDCVEKLAEVIGSVRSLGKGVFLAYVEAYHAERALPISEATMKDCRGELRPLLIAKTNLSTPVINSYMSDWQRAVNQDAVASGKPEVFPMQAQVECSECGKKGAWKKQIEGEYVCGTCYKELTTLATPETTEDSDSAVDTEAEVNVKSLSANVHQWTATGNEETDKESARMFLQGLVNKYAVWGEVVKEIGKSKIVKVA